MSAQASSSPSTNVYLVYSTTEWLHYGSRGAYRDFNAAAQWCRTGLLQWLQWPVNAGGLDPIPIGVNLWKTSGANSVSGISAVFIIERRQLLGTLPAGCTDLYLVCEETSCESPVEDGHIPGVQRLHCIHDMVVLSFYLDIMSAQARRDFEDSRRQVRRPGYVGGVFLKRVPLV